MRRKPEDTHEMHTESYDYMAGDSLFSTEFMVPSTSQVPGNPEESDFQRPLQDEDLESSFLRGDKTMTLTKLHEMTMKPKPDLFMKLLWGAKRGDFTLHQKNPEKFDEIVMTKVGF